MNKIFKIVHCSDSGRIGYLKANGKKVETPVMFFQYPFRRYVFFWDRVSIDSLLVNAHFLTRKKKLFNEVRDIGLHKFLKFNGMVMMDSGGHQIQKYGYSIHAHQISMIYNELKPDIGVVLDKPVHPGMSVKEIETSSNYMIQNYSIMKSNTGITLLPVIHGYSEAVIRKCIKSIQSPVWGIGSLVPLILGKSSNVIGNNSVVGIKKGKKLLIKTVFFIRRILDRGVFLHVFGIGSALTMHLMFYLGVDSVDSASYEWFARYGHIQIPGKGRVNITGLAHERRSKSKKIDWNSYECDCPVCSDTPKRRLVEVLKKSKDARAIHNLHVHSNEVKLAREHIKENNYESFVEQRLKGTQFYKLFRYAQQFKKRGLLRGNI